MSTENKQTREVPAASPFYSLGQISCQPPDPPAEDQPNVSVSMRQKAEALFRTRESVSQEKLEALPPDALRAILHELSVHQIELEMQNEELRRAQADLDASRARYFDLYDLAPVGYLTVNEKGFILEANLAAAALLGVDRAALMKKPVSHFIYKEDQDIFCLLENSPIELIVAQTCDLRMLKPDGTIFWAHLKKGSARDENGVPGCSIVLSDVTWRKQTEESLREQETHLEAILEAAADGILAVDTKGKVLRASRRFSEIWRIPEPLMASGDDKTLLDFVLNQLSDPDAFIEKVQALYDSDEESFDTLTFKDGRFIERYSFAMIMGGERIGRVWSFRDVTARMQAQEELYRKTAEQERFTYTVSHDLKSPLVTIQTFLGYLEKDLEHQKTEPVAKDLGFIHRAADKMALLLDELLNLARVGYSKNEFKKVSLQEIAQEALSLVAGQITDRGVQVDVTVEPVWLYGDHPRLVEIFQNLLDNAVKFLGDQPSPRVEIGAEQQGGDKVLFVRDNGKGIDPRHQAKVFGIFEKLDASAKGAGLGLALVKRIVELHGGRIWVESEGVGQGATFRFTLAKTQHRQQKSIPSVCRPF